MYLRVRHSITAPLRSPTTTSTHLIVQTHDLLRRQQIQSRVDGAHQISLGGANYVTRSAEMTVHGTVHEQWRCGLAELRCRVVIVVGVVVAASLQLSLKRALRQHRSWRDDCLVLFVRTVTVSKSIVTAVQVFATTWRLLSRRRRGR